MNNHPRTTATQLYINAAGSAVPEPVMAALAEAVVEQHVHLPGMFTLRFYDTNVSLLDEGVFNLGVEVEIAAEKPGGDRVVLVNGEITALEPSFEDGMVSELVVRGFDKLHRLYRQPTSHAYLNKKDSDMAQEIAGKIGLKTSGIETTTTVYEHVYQHNQSDLAFLMQRAWRIGYECYVADGTLYFRKPSAAKGQAALKWGQELRTFYPRMSVAEQVSRVQIQGWDVDKQQPIVGKAEKGELYPQIEEQKNGKGWAEAKFDGGEMVVVDQPLYSQAEANILAQARLNELSGTFVAAEGTALRRPDLTAGQVIQLEDLGHRFSGSYLLTSVTHRYSDEGLTADFAVQGARTGLLSEQFRQQEPFQRWAGVVTAVVTNSDDPKKWGRVKLKYPWLSDEVESHWARVAAPGAGPEAGLSLIPAVNDEVLVAFEHGDFNRPFVLGGMWNGKAKLPEATAGAKEQELPLVRSWRSRTGHQIVMHDDQQNKVTLVTAAGHQLTLDDANKQIELTSEGGLVVRLDDNSSTITVESSSNLELKAANIKVEADSNIDIKAGGQVNVKGSMINLN